MQICILSYTLKDLLNVMIVYVCFDVNAIVIFKVYILLLLNLHVIMILLSYFALFYKSFE